MGRLPQAPSGFRSHRKAFCIVTILSEEEWFILSCESHVRKLNHETKKVITAMFPIVLQEQGIVRLISFSTTAVAVGCYLTIPFTQHMEN